MNDDETPLSSICWRPPALATSPSHLLQPRRLLLVLLVQPVHAMRARLQLHQPRVAHQPQRSQAQREVRREPQQRKPGVPRPPQQRAGRAGACARALAAAGRANDDAGGALRLLLL
jgi:hypothetical protein